MMGAADADHVRRVPAASGWLRIEVRQMCKCASYVCEL